MTQQQQENLAEIDNSNSDDMLLSLKQKFSLSSSAVAKILGTSLVAVQRWERGDGKPTDAQSQQIAALLRHDSVAELKNLTKRKAFSSYGAKRAALRDPSQSSLFDEVAFMSAKASEPLPSIISRIKHGSFFGADRADFLAFVNKERRAAVTPNSPMLGGMSAGKNTYTYDAHTYHTKVPPQGIAEFIRHYLPEGGVVLDPFGGSGMTGVAARICGADVVLNELSPAASFICHNFTESISATKFAAALKVLNKAVAGLRKRLYSTHCRECGKDTEILHTVWSYRVICPCCSHEFVLWDHCRKYGKTVKDHKILSEFACPSCGENIKKRTLKRTVEVPVLVGYRCCQGAKQAEHPLSEEDKLCISQTWSNPEVVDGFYPTNAIPDGDNLTQPKKHGITTIDKFYTPRALVALSNLWHEIHKFHDPQIAAALAFAFTSLYQRVTRLSEFRFWGGSGNTAHFNVPFISNEANVFATFDRKARSIFDHLATTATEYSGKKAVICGSATDLHEIPDETIDFIFTDPPFGANINYSEMNILWESWLGEYTDSTSEAIMNKTQRKSLSHYQSLMTQSFRECYRALRPNHWMVVVFMNSSGAVWQSLRESIVDAGFSPERIDIFDKQHGTFKQFVSENTAGCDLVLHCKKVANVKQSAKLQEMGLPASASILEFLAFREGSLPTTVFLHVDREDEIDFRQMYSEWLSFGIIRGHEVIDFSGFREVVIQKIKEGKE